MVAKSDQTASENKQNLPELSSFFIRLMTHSTRHIAPINGRDRDSSRSSQFLPNLWTPNTIAAAMVKVAKTFRTAA